MMTMKLEKEREVGRQTYQKLAEKNSTLYHIAHARKENHAEDYDSARLLEIAESRVEDDVKRMRDVLGHFRERSIARDVQDEQ